MVDSESGLQDKGHVFSEDGTIYSVTLNKSDVTLGTNSFYVIQIIESNDVSTKSNKKIIKNWKIIY